VGRIEQRTKFEQKVLMEFLDESIKKYERQLEPVIAYLSERTSTIFFPQETRSKSLLI